jgi:hypothetical protein
MDKPAGTKRSTKIATVVFFAFVAYMALTFVIK